ncbi:hypothetical protein [Lampropedia aestuarii]|uniref:hypothetical protein n=1 Tax=Lampropedia aestuarii TaxID=2562762 RepID=UPI001980D5AA|nr:hypothetical protein [Lampropedia aestuarii]
MNIILENSQQVDCYTDMAATFTAMRVNPRHYEWFVSDVETNGSVPLLSQGNIWITGDELADVLEARIQFIWAVFSAFPVGMRIAVEKAPVADGNPSFWQQPKLLPQLTGACFEVVCWDSCATILIGVSEAQAAAFSRTYFDAKPLSCSGDGF